VLLEMRGRGSMVPLQTAVGAAGRRKRKTHVSNTPDKEGRKNTLIQSFRWVYGAKLFGQDAADSDRCQLRLKYPKDRK
jgi:hypothetical protein